MPHIRKPKKVTVDRFAVCTTYGGIDEDIKQVFFCMAPNILSQIFKDYKAQHGEKKAEYARRAYTSWKSGEVKMTGQICERLLNIVPSYLDFATKYDLLGKLWRKQNNTLFTITLNPYYGIESAVAILNQSFANLKGSNIPDAVLARLDWLSDGDGVAAQALYGEMLEREFVLTQENLHHEISTMFKLYQDVPTTLRVTATQSLQVPGGKVLITLSPNYNKYPPGWIPPMSTEQPKQPGDALQKVNQELAPPIQNTNDLLGEALKRMTPEKQSEVLGKAADEALRLQVKGS
ncbi:MAG: hypothetical protein QM703_21130 [Gemmatales bacterium]